MKIFLQNILCQCDGLGDSAILTLLAARNDGQVAACADGLWGYLLPMLPREKKRAHTKLRFAQVQVAVSASASAVSKHKQVWVFVASDLPFFCHGFGPRRPPASCSPPGETDPFHADSDPGVPIIGVRSCKVRVSIYAFAHIRGVE